MRKLLIILFLLLINILNVYSQRKYQSIGVRIGDPFGVTYKVFFRNNTAIEWNAGVIFSGWHTKYYRKSFERENPGLYYYDHHLDFAWGLQGRFQRYYPFPGELDVDGLSWFWGFGGQFRMADIKYLYQSQTGFSEIYKLADINYDMGVDVMVGAEYEIPEIPLVAFSEICFNGEIVDDPVRIRFMGAIGIRYIFK